MEGGGLSSRHPEEGVRLKNRNTAESSICLLNTIVEPYASREERVECVERGGGSARYLIVQRSTNRADSLIWYSNLLSKLHEIQTLVRYRL